jgi:hypothetical protein
MYTISLRQDTFCKLQNITDASDELRNNFPLGALAKICCSWYETPCGVTSHLQLAKINFQVNL